MAQALFTVEQRIILSSTKGSPLDTVTVRGDGFEALSNVTIYFDGIDVTPPNQPQTDYFGSFETTFTVPLRPNGTYIVMTQSQGFWIITAEAEFTIVPKITFWPQSSGARTYRWINCYGYAPSVSLTAYFGTINITLLGSWQTGLDGTFGFTFYIPQVDDGIYLVNVTDAVGNSAVAPFIVGSPILSLTPNKISASSLVKAIGTGFLGGIPIVLYLENMTMTSLIDIIWTSDNLMTNADGSFEYSFIVPITEPGTYNITAYSIGGSSPPERKRIASTLLTIVDDSPLCIEIDVGKIHFAGEIAEFYATISHNGQLVNATIDKAMLYYSEGFVSYELTENVEQLGTGVYRIPYTIPPAASVGTYTLMIEASYSTMIVESRGVSSASFLASPTLTSQNVQIATIENNIATIIIPDLGAIRANLTTLDAKLNSLNNTMATIQTSIGTIVTNITNIQLHVTSINGSAATIQTILGVLQGNITSIDGKIATIQTIIGTVQADIGDLASESIPLDYEISLITLILTFIAATGAMLTTVLFLRKKTGSPRVPSPSETPQQPLPP